MNHRPELKIITRHGGEPWTQLMVKLLLKWPNLHYSTSAFAPKHYNKDIIDFANTRGADKIIYAGYYPMGLDIDRIFAELPHVPFRDQALAKRLESQAPLMQDAILKCTQALPDAQFLNPDQTALKTSLISAIQVAVPTFPQDGILIPQLDQGDPATDAKP